MVQLFGEKVGKYLNYIATFWAEKLSQLQLT